MSWLKNALRHNGMPSFPATEGRHSGPNTQATSSRSNGINER